VPRAADVDRGGALRVGFGAVDIGPGGGVENKIASKAVRSGTGDVPLVLVEGYDLVIRKRLDQRPPELTARAGD
jgi:hypothetical protein